MYELIILSHLMRQPAHGYLIAKIINDIIGPYAKVSNGRFYPLLAKLEKDGLIEAYSDPANEQQNDRQAHSYAITPKGRERFHALMLDTTSNPGEYQRIFLYKVYAFGFLAPEERLYLLDHYINYCQTHVLHQRAEAEDLVRHADDYRISPNQLEVTLNVIQHLAQQWQLELEWAGQLRLKETVQSEQAIPTN